MFQAHAMIRVRQFENVPHTSVISDDAEGRPTTYIFSFENCRSRAPPRTSNYRSYAI